MNKGITHTIKEILRLNAPRALSGDQVYAAVTGVPVAKTSKNCVKTLLTQRCKQGPQPKLWRKVGRDRYCAL